MRRRDFITLLAGAAWPLAARAQQAAVPEVGLLDGVVTDAARIAAVRQGLKQAGFVDGQNVMIDYRSAEGVYERLPALAADMVRQKYAVILAMGSTNSPKAAKAATSTIPIVFYTGSDPVVTGLINNLRRPEANLTGVTSNTTALTPKRLEIARELLPGSTSVGYLRNPANLFDTDMAELRAAADALGFRLSVFNASTDREILTAFEAMAQQKVSVLIPSTDAFFLGRSNQIVALAGHHAIPAIYTGREFTHAGGLASYGVEVFSLYRQVGLYAGRILKGDKPADLPVLLPTKFELVINSTVAKELGLEIPLSMLIRADEVIE